MQKEISELLIRHVLSKVIVDESRIPRKYYNMVYPLTSEFNRWMSSFDELDLEKPETWVSTVGRVAYKLVESPQVSSDPITEYLMDKNVTKIENCIKWMVVAVFKELKPLELCLEQSSNKLVSFETPKGNIIYFTLDKNAKKSGDPFESCFASAEGDKHSETMREIADIFWAKRNAIFMDYEEGQIKTKETKLSKREYKGEVLELIRDLKKFHDHNIRRVVILQGDPGTGKSTLCANAAKELSNRTLVLSHTFIQNVESFEWFEVIETLQPFMVIVDDIDRVPMRYMENSLDLFEDSQYHVPITLMTTNDQDRLPDAFRRPGRVDQIIDMPDPEHDIKLDMIQQFCDDVGVDYPPPHRVEFMCKMLDNRSGAFIREMLCRYKVYGWDYEPPDNDMIYGKNATPQSHNSFNGRQPSDLESIGQADW